jgi:hypothetical protein
VKLREQGRHPHRLAPGDEARGGDRIAADVVEPAATPAEHVADVGGVGEVIAEMAMNGLQLTQSSALHQRPQLVPLRVRAHHEGFLDRPAGAVADGDQLARLGRAHPDRLLAQDMLAGLRRLHGPGHVEMVGERDIDRLDLGVGQERLVAVVGAWDAELTGGGLGQRPLAGSNCDHLAVMAALHGWDHLFTGDPGRTENAEFQLRHAALPDGRSRLRSSTSHAAPRSPA